MKVIPAIDLLDGQVVRLFQGKYDQVTRYFTDPVEALHFLQSKGAQRLHIVDLNGSKQGSSVNHTAIKGIAKHSSIPIQVGGGIRSFEDVQALQEVGVSYMVIGSLLFTDPSTFLQIKERFSDCIIAALDVKNGRIRTVGWEQDTGVTIESLLETELLKGIHALMVTDIKLDGSLQGPSLELMRGLMKHPDYKWIASGGVRDHKDLVSLKALGLYGAIVGKAVYEGRITQLEDLC